MHENKPTSGTDYFVTTYFSNEVAKLALTLRFTLAAYMIGLRLKIA